MRVHKCRWCREKLGNNEYAAFCPNNPNAERNRIAWRNGDKRFRFIRKSKVVIGPVLVLA